MSLFDIHIQRHRSLPSTNTAAVEQARRGAPEGLVITAAEQTAGRGRHDRTWASPADAGLYFSLVLRPRFPAARFPLVTMLAALSVRDALLSTAKLDTDLKWSNDVFAGGRKLCGILAERIETSHGAAVVLGVGVNLRRESFPPEIADRATSVETETGIVIDPNNLLGEILRAVNSRYGALHLAAGDAELLREFAENSTYVQGKSVRVLTGTESFEGTTRGLARDGALRVELPDGEIKIIHAGDVAAVRATRDL